MGYQCGVGSMIIISENGEETPIGIASMSSLEMSDQREPAMIPNLGEKIFGQTFTMQIEEPEKAYSRLLGIILLHHRRN